MDGGLGLALLVAGLWGLQPILQKSLVADIGPDLPLVLGGLFYFAALLLFAAVRWPHMRHHMHAVRPRHVALAAVTTVLCAFAANIVFLRLLRHHDSFWVTAIAYSSPVITAVLAMWLLREYMDAVAVAGVALVTIGVIVLSWKRQRS